MIAGILIGLVLFYGVASIGDLPWPALLLGLALATASAVFFGRRDQR